MRTNRRISGVALLAAISLLGGVPSADATSRPEVGSRARGRTHVTYASWYGFGFANRRTASGELFDPSELTAAHRTLPLGSRVRVTNLTNGRSVVLRITDRGPYCKGRGIDVSREAARRLRMVNQGVAKVEVEQLPVNPPGGEPMLLAIAAWPSALDGGRALSL
jgi:rare lipoprotein A